jgi:ribosome maturation factor RimP
VSRQVTGVLDVEDPIRGGYDLEVSSPGLDRPLYTVEQFRRYVGEAVRIRLKAKLEGRRQLAGRLESVSEETIEVQEDSRRFAVPVDMIDRARLIPGS